MIRRRLLSGSITNLLAKVTTVGIWFLLTPLLLDRLAPGGYALWVLMGTVSSYGLLLDFGFGGAVVKYVAEHKARGERDGARAVVASAVWLYLGLALTALVLSVLISPTLPRLLGVAPDQQSTARWLVILSGVNVAMTIAVTPAVSVLRGLQRYDVYNGLGVFNALLEGAVTAGALLAGWGLLGMIAAQVPITLVTCLASVHLVRRIAPEVPFGWRGANLAALRRLTAFSSSIFAIQIAGRLQNKTDEFVIAFWQMLNSVTPYALARKLGELTQTIAVQILKVLMPLASELDAGDRLPQLRHLYIVASRVALGIAVPITVVLAVRGDAILTMWVGPEYAQYASLVTVLAAASLITTSQWPAVEILQGMARHRLVASISLAAGVANIVLSILLLPHLGLLGVAFGTLIPTALASLGVVMPFANRTLGVSWNAALRGIWLPAVVPGAGAAAVLWMLQRHVASPSFAMLIAWVSAAAIVYAAGYLSMPASGAERQLLSDLFTSGSRGLRRLRPDLSRTA